MAKVLIINGPNLNLLGIREPSIYGSLSMEEYLTALQSDYPQVEIDYFQSNHEGDIIDRIHEVGFEPDLNGIILNAGAFTHTSLAIADAIRAVERPVVEVHISDIEKREEFRHLSVTAPVCIAQIRGHGFESYTMGIDLLAGAKQ